MTRVRTTVTLDDEVLRAVKIRAARLGRGDSEVIEASLRRDLGLDLLDQLWAGHDFSEDDAIALAVEAQHSTRPTKNR
jgi:plasmid stability protein